MEEKPEFMALLGTVRMANAVPKTVTHDIITETGSNGQEMEDVNDDGYDDGAGSVELRSMVDKLVDECQIDREEALKRLGLLRKQSKRLRIHGKQTRRMGSVFLSECRLFGDEGTMTEPEQIQAKISSMETMTLTRDPLAVPKFHERTAAAMSVLGSPSGPVCKVHIYTDGSFKEADGETEFQAAWAFVVILEHFGAEYNFDGFAAGSLAVGNCDMRSPAWVGALKVGCDNAELAGITSACRWCTGRMSAELGQGGLPVVLHVDSQYAISSVNGHGRPGVNEEAVHYARPAKCILGTLSAVTFEWIAGHIGYPWNELADVAAKQTAHGPATSATNHVGDVDPLLTRRQLDGFFLSRLAVSEDHLGGELYRTFPHEVACLLHPIFAKAALRYPANHGRGGAVLCMRREGHEAL